MVRIIITPFITAAEIPREPRARVDSPLFKQQYFEQKKAYIETKIHHKIT